MCAPTARKAASKPPAVIVSSDVVDLGVELEARRRDRAMRCDLGIEHVARQPVFRNAEAHHAARQRPGFVDRHGVAEPRR